MRLVAVKAGALYAVAKERCDDFAGNAKDVFRTEANSVHVTAAAEAELNEKTALNSAEAVKEINSAKKGAAEKCDGLAGDPKARCVSDAKAKLGQN